MAKKAATKAAQSKPAASGTDKKGPRPRTKGEIYTKLAEVNGLTKKQVAGVFDSMAELIRDDLGKKGPRQFVIPGLIKIKIKRKPATKAGPKMNPFTKEMVMRPAKPASDAVKVLPLKSLKEMV